MYEKMLKLKEEKKWLFYLLIIPFLIIAALEFYNRYLINSGKEAVEEAKKEDKKLEIKQKVKEEQAKEEEKKAEKIKEDIENIEVDKDWHLK